MVFIIVKFGGNRYNSEPSSIWKPSYKSGVANEEHIFNSNCLCAVLLNHIKKTCGYDAVTEPLDLAFESGEVMDLWTKPKEYARKYVDARGVYVLVKVLGGTDFCSCVHVGEEL